MQKIAVTKQIKNIKAIMMLLLLLNIISSNIFIANNNASATSQFVTFSVEAASTLSISVASQVNLDITPSNTGTFGNVDLPITVKTNNEYGYNLTMSAYNTNLLRNTALSNGAIPTIPTIDDNSGSGYTTEQFTSSSSTMNKWGYKIGSGNYGPVAVNATTLKECGVTELSSSTCTPQTAAGDVTTLNFASKIDNSTPSGKYSTTLILMAVANVATSNCTTGNICYNANGADGAGTMSNQTADGTADTTLWASNFSNTGYGFAGWNTKSDGTGTSYGPNQTLSTTELTNLISQNSGNGITLYANWIPAERNGGTIITMQDWVAQDGCSKMTVGAITALKDARDNNVYAIAKLPMWDFSANNGAGAATGSACWMIENMRITNSATISGTNTNNPLNTFTELATSTTSWCTNQNAECYNQSKLNTINTTTNSNYAGATGNGNGNNLAVYTYGNYYNWYSATAGNGTYEVSANATSVDGDICPLNWYLPKGGSFGTQGGQTVNTQNSDFFKLMKAIVPNNTDPNQINQYNQYYYDNTTGATGALRSYPNNFVYSGNWAGGQVYNRGTGGGYWSSTANNAAYAYYLTFYSSDVVPGTYYNVKYYGFSARCVAGS